MATPRSISKSTQVHPSHSDRQADLELSMRKVHRLLRKRYGECNHGNKANPLHELLFIICSVQTQEANYVRTYRALRGRSSDGLPTRQDMDRLQKKIPQELRSHSTSTSFHSAAKVARQQNRVAQDVHLPISAGEAHTDP